MSWYKTGTVTVTNGSATVTGAGTLFVGAVQAGAAFVGPNRQVYEVVAVISATQLTISPAYVGSSQPGAAYGIFPTYAALVSFNTRLNTLLVNYESVLTGAGAGKFLNGTAALPSMSFVSDPDTGLYRPASNQMAASTGGVRRWLLSNTAFQVDVPITGTAVTQNDLDMTSGRLMKVGYGGLGSGSPPSPPNNDMDDFEICGFFQFTSTDANIPFSFGAGINLARFDALGGQLAIERAPNGRMAYRPSPDGTTFGDWRTVITETTAQSLYGLGNSIKSIDLTIADDAVGTVTTPRNGGWVFVTTQGRGNFPDQNTSGLTYYDTGGSPRMDKVTTGGTSANFKVSNDLVLTGTAGIDGDLTVSAQPANGTLKVENRTGASVTIQMTFL
jgi:hypothetical protein